MACIGSRYSKERSGRVSRKKGNSRVAALTKAALNQSPRTTRNRYDKIDPTRDYAAWLYRFGLCREAEPRGKASSPPDASQEECRTRNEALSFRDAQSRTRNEPFSFRNAQTFARRAASRVMGDPSRKRVIALHNVLKDPMSAVVEFSEPVRDMHLLQPFNGASLHACWRGDVNVNSKNSFGAYEGFTKYQFWFYNNKLIDKAL
jgi:hypothetical protein